MGIFKSAIKMDDIEKRVFQFISESPEKISFRVLRGYLVKNFQFSTKEAKSLVSKLVQSGSLYYTNHYGNDYLEPSFDKPVMISENIVVKPSFLTYRPHPGQTVIEIEKGISFGCGNHPSTRLAIRLIDNIFSNYSWNIDKKKLSALDIGTGSGILAIVAAKLGVGFVCGVDTDPCSVFEARKNIDQNKVDKIVKIINGELEVVGKSYSMVLANLRFPSLMGLREILDTTITERGLFVFSGLKEDEIVKIEHEYEKSGFMLANQLTELGWGACMLLRGDF
jgi:ribosomal protein L11 methyltransferase